MLVVEFLEEHSLRTSAIQQAGMACLFLMNLKHKSPKWYDPRKTAISLLTML